MLKAFQCNFSLNKACDITSEISANLSVFFGSNSKTFHVTSEVLNIRKGTGKMLFAVLLYFEYWLMLFFVLFLSAFRHPRPLNDVSKLSTGMKVSSLLLIAIFALSIAPLATL
jgi:hypothetical protein